MCRPSQRSYVALYARATLKVIVIASAPASQAITARRKVAAFERFETG
jgi:hypothetical protein